METAVPQLVPIFLPAPIVDERKLDLDNDFNYEATQLAWDARGRLLVLGYLFYNYQRYDSTDDRDFSTCTINVYGPDLAPAFIAETSQLYEGHRRRRCGC